MKIPKASPRTTLDDIESLANTNEYNKKQGPEVTRKNLGSQNVSQKSTSTKINPPKIVDNREGISLEI
jgi:hypothetical protein